MNAEIIVIRLLHIVPAVIWAGSAVFVAIIIVPRLRNAGTLSDVAAYGGVARSAVRLMNIVGGLTVLFGLALTFRMDGFSLLFTSAWGWAITIGFVVSILALGASGAMMSASRRLANADSGSNEMAMISGDNESAIGRVGMIANLNAVLVVVAVCAMAAARFV